MLVEENFIQTDRLMRMDFEVPGGHTISILNVYAPTDTKSTEIKDAFYQELRREVKTLTTNAIRMAREVYVLGDFNATVVSTGQLDTPNITKAVGGFSSDTENSNGTRLVSLAQEFDLCLAHTMFEEEEDQAESTQYGEFANARGTFRHAPTGHWWTPDHILCPQHAMGEVRSVQVIKDHGGVRRTDADFTDHRMLLLTRDSKTPSRPRRQSQPERQRHTKKAKLVWDQRRLTRLSDQDKRALGTELNTLFAALSVETQGNFSHLDILRRIKGVGVAKGYLKPKVRKPRKKWVIEDKEYHLVNSKLYEARQQRTQSPSLARRYAKLHKRMQKIRKRIKWEQDTAIGKQLARLYEDGQVGEFYEFKAEVERRGDGLQVEAVELEDGSVTRTTEDILARMQRHMKQLLGTPGTAIVEEAIRIMKGGKGKVPPDLSLQREITWTEVAAALHRFQNGKAQGPGGKEEDDIDICIEILKNATVDSTVAGTEQDFRVHLARWFSRGLVDSLDMDADLSLIRCILIPKITGTKKMDKFRGLSIMNTLRRLLSLIVLARLDKFFEEAGVYMENQFAFRGNKSITHACQLFQHFQWLSKKRERDIYVTYLDIAKAYDNVDWDLLARVLAYYGVPEQLVQLISQLLTNSEMFVQFRGQHSETFKLQKAVPQGDPLSPILFAVYMTFLFRDCYAHLQHEDQDSDRERMQMLDEDLLASSVKDKEVTALTLKLTRASEGIPMVYKEIDRTEFVPRTQAIQKYTGKINDTSKSETIHAVMYADDTITGGTTVSGAIETTRRHTRAAAIGGLTIHPGKLRWMQLVGTSANRSAKEFIIDGQKITRKMNKRHLGSYFSGTYDHGKSNCAQRVAMSRRIMETQLRNVLLNREIKRKLKLVLYRSDVVSVAMHGVEYWNIRKTGGKLEKFQRKSLLSIFNRTWRSQIPSMAIYEAIRKLGMRFYPMKLTMAERKLRYFGTLIRQPKPDLASRMFNSDMLGRHNQASHQLEHFGDIREALKMLAITPLESTQQYRDVGQWRKFLLARKEAMYQKYVEEWKVKYNGRQWQL